ncbi:expressed unknown protein [Ectocarpus siliculosus]|uniref:Uncharacterized protein n=1 Tax=Ectocarpus siliculosus TaxID=2880 RepID=D7FMF2_ECTSI|nr:expressed unknown protein [Ectocarpus siliculosus]|eukprot:CBJ29964.1 expressed unknown protein [Ectocarpus siliculosus]
MASSGRDNLQERLVDRPSDDDPARTSLGQQREAVQPGYSRGRGVVGDDASAAGRDLERQTGIALIPTGGPGGSPSVNITEGEPTPPQPVPSTWGGLRKGLWQLARLVLMHMYYAPLLFDPVISEKTWNLLVVDVRGAVCGLFGAALLQAFKLALRTTSWGWVKGSNEMMRKQVVKYFGSSTRTVRDVVTYALPLVAFFHTFLEWGFRGVVTVGLAETTSLSTAAIALVSAVVFGPVLALRAVEGEAGERLMSPLR